MSDVFEEYHHPENPKQKVVEPAEQVKNVNETAIFANENAVIKEKKELEQEIEVEKVEKIAENEQEKGHEQQHDEQEIDNEKTTDEEEKSHENQVEVESKVDDAKQDEIMRVILESEERVRLKKEHKVEENNSELSVVGKSTIEN